MIVIKYKYPVITRVDRPANARITRTQVTIVNVGWNDLLFVRNRFTAPWSVLSVRGNNNPLFAERVPAFFPNPCTC